MLFTPLFPDFQVPVGKVVSGIFATHKVVTPKIYKSRNEVGRISKKNKRGNIHGQNNVYCTKFYTTHLTLSHLFVKISVSCMWIH